MLKYILELQEPVIVIKFVHSHLLLGAVTKQCEGQSPAIIFKFHSIMKLKSNIFIYKNFWLNYQEKIAHFDKFNILVPTYW